MKARFRSSGAFTLIELLAVMAVIAILVGLILGVAGYVQKKAARDRARAEIAAMETALESYRADNGIYPQNEDTDALDARAQGNPSGYQAASRFFYIQLSGDTDGDPSNGIEGKGYMEFKPNMLNPKTPGPNTLIVDPFGNSYGYSTAYRKWQDAGSESGQEKGYNPTFDLWSTAGGSGKQSGESEEEYRMRWITNW